MIHQFQITYLRNHHNRGQFIFARQLHFDQPITVQEGALLHRISVYHYEAMYPLSDRHGQPQPDIYVFRPVLERYPDGHFQEGQLVELVNPDIPA